MEITREEFCKLYKLAYIDTMTGCYNRNWLLEKIKEDKLCVLKSKSYNLVLVDVNNLKKINDKKGHLAGDLIIEETANILKRLSRFVVRIGGDEFLLILSKINDKVLDSLNTDKFSFGIAKADSSNNYIFSETFRKADLNMYKNKKQNAKENKL